MFPLISVSAGVGLTGFGVWRLACAVVFGVGLGLAGFGFGCFRVGPGFEFGFWVWRWLCRWDWVLVLLVFHLARLGCQLVFGLAGLEEDSCGQYVLLHHEFHKQSD